MILKEAIANAPFKPVGAVVTTNVGDVYYADLTNKYPLGSSNIPVYDITHICEDENQYSERVPEYDGQISEEAELDKIVLIAPDKLKMFIANHFSHILHSWLGEETMQKVVAENKINPENCATGDYCDSNMAMDEAMQAFGISIDLQNSTHTSLWNEVWEMAKQNNFQPIKL